MNNFNPCLMLMPGHSHKIINGLYPNCSKFLCSRIHIITAKSAPTKCIKALIYFVKSKSFDVEIFSGKLNPITLVKMC